MKKIYWAIIKEDFNGKMKLEMTEPDCCCADEGYVLYDTKAEAIDSIEWFKESYPERKVRVVKVKLSEYKELIK